MFGDILVTQNQPSVLVTVAATHPGGNIRRRKEK